VDIYATFFRANGLFYDCSVTGALYDALYHKKAGDSIEVETVMDKKGRKLTWPEVRTRIQTLKKRSHIRVTTEITQNNTMIITKV